MKRILIGLLLLTLLFSGCTKKSNVVAKVNDTEIYQEELDRQMVLTEISYTVNGYEFPSSAKGLEELEEKMLNNIVESYVLVDIAKNKGIDIDEEEANSQSKALIEGLLAIYGTEEAYEGFLNEKGQKRADFESYLLDLSRSNEYIYNLYDEVTSGISVTEDEAKAYYQENSKYYSYSTVSVLGIETEDEKRAKDIRDEILQDGLPFEEAIGKFQDADGVIRASDYGDLYYGDMGQEFSDQAFAMEIGEMSKVFKGEASYFIIYLYDKDVQDSIAYDEIKSTVEGDLLQQKRYSKYDEFFNSQKDKYSITKNN